MLPTEALQASGQSLWLDFVSRGQLDSGWFEHLLDTLSITGLTSSLVSFAHAIGRGRAYDTSLVEGQARGLDDERLFFQLALEDLTRVADLLRPLHTRSYGRDGWVSLDVSPRLLSQPQALLQQARVLQQEAARPNLMVKVPGTPELLRTLEEATFEGVPLNVTLLFSARQCVAAADALLRGLERRVEAGRSPDVLSVLSLFVSRWDRAVAGQVPGFLHNRLGIAMAWRTWRAWNVLAVSDRVVRLADRGVHMPRMVWASTRNRDPGSPETLYVEALQAANTILTMPESTLRAFADHGRVGPPMPRDGGDCEQVLADVVTAGVDLEALADTLQSEGTRALRRTWEELLGFIALKRLEREGPPLPH